MYRILGYRILNEFLVGLLRCQDGLVFCFAFRFCNKSTLLKGYFLTKIERLSLTRFGNIKSVTFHKASENIYAIIQ